MNVLAQELNETLKSSCIYNLLSTRGKDMYFPKGIVAQSAEAGEKAKLYNATVGLATTKGEPFCLSDIYSQFSSDLKKSEIFSYAPGGGDRALRALWREKIYEKNPTLKGKTISSSFVTSGLTHTISLIALLFVDRGDEVVCPDLYWDNYQLIFEDSSGGILKTFKCFNSEGKFNAKEMKKALMETKGDSARIILNFPNNPTGYSPSKEEREEIVEAIKEVADTGKKILVICDDAYFGLFYEDDTEKESLFSYLADASPNILAIKGDAATKEEMVWGFRVGFITFASSSLKREEIEALEKKILGAIRCTVSNCDRPGQSLLLKAMLDGKHYLEDKEILYYSMEKRYRTVKEAVLKHKENNLIVPYPFNSGYFMAFDTLGKNAEELRMFLLDKYKIGTINIMGHSLRLAYCSVEEENLENLIDTVYKAAEELWS